MVDILAIAEEHQNIIDRLFEDPVQVLSIQESAAILATALKNGHKILLCGNGGSAADAQHISAEFVGRFVKERAPLAAIALTTDTSALTAVSNDYGYAHVFSRQVEALGNKNDVLIAISTSGNSPNVRVAAQAAAAKNMSVISLTGVHINCELLKCSTVSVRVPSTVTSRIQEAHILIGHILCELVEDILSN